MCTSVNFGLPYLPLQPLLCGDNADNRKKQNLYFALLFYELITLYWRSWDLFFMKLKFIFQKVSFFIKKVWLYKT